MSYQFLAESRPKARKEHDCVWCREKIVKGDIHFKQVGVYSEDFQSSRFHPECYEALGKYLTDTGEDEFMPHDFKRGTIEQV